MGLKEERRPGGPPLVCHLGTCWRSFPRATGGFASSVTLNRLSPPILERRIAESARKPVDMRAFLSPGQLYPSLMPCLVSVLGRDCAADAQAPRPAGPSGRDPGCRLRRVRGVSALSPAKRGVGFVFQHYALFPHMSVADNIAYPLRMPRVGKGKRRDRVRRVLELVQREGLEERLPGALRRTAAASRLRPCSRLRPGRPSHGRAARRLDPGLRIELQDELRRVHCETGVTALYVTHD